MDVRNKYKRQTNLFSQLTLSINCHKIRNYTYTSEQYLMLKVFYCLFKKILRHQISVTKYDSTD